jgi:uncharacterized protein involved in exopolysaccharide biosynthesis
MLMRHGYLPVVAATVVVVFVTVTVFMASLAETPQYESSGKILIGQEGWGTQGPSEPVGDIERLQGSTMTLAEAADSRPIAEDTIERLALRYADAITLSDRDADEELFDRVRGLFGEDALIELTTVIAWENSSSKFNRALRVPSQGLWKH